MAKILVLAAIAQVFSLAIIAKVMQQTEAVYAISQKAIFQNVQRDIDKVLSHPAGCLAALKHVTLNDARVGDANYFIPLNQISEAGTLPRTVVAVGQNPHGMDRRALVEAIRLSRLSRIAPDSYEAELFVVAKLPSQSLNSSPTKIRILTEPTSPLGAKTVTSCGLSQSSSGVLSACRIVEAVSAGVGPSQASCNPSEIRLSGGGSCLTSTGADWNRNAPPDDYGFLFQSEPVVSGGVQGWVADCRNHYGPDSARTKAYAYCCTL